MRLHEQRDYYKRLAELNAELLHDVMLYVKSPKFDDDNMCNVNDIILRIEEGQHRIYAHRIASGEI